MKSNNSKCSAIISALLCLTLVLSLSACGKVAGEIKTSGPGDAANEAPADSGEPRKVIDEGKILPENKVPETGLNYVTHVVRASYYYSEDNFHSMPALNSSKLMINSVMHLPVLKCGTKTDFDAFTDYYINHISGNPEYYKSQPYLFSDGENTYSYDEDFFKENTLILAYLTASSGSFRFGVNKVYLDDNSFCVYINQTNNPEVFTCDMAAWLVLVEVPDADIAGCTEFDAQMGSPLE